MAQLPTPGGDAGNWGTILNDFLKVEHNTDGTLKNSGSLATKANTSHSHAIGDVTSLQVTLDGKAASGHTHTAANITDFAEVTRDTIGTALVAGSNITITPNDGADTITIASSGSSGASAYIDAKTDHGAVGDGTADDTAKLQAFLDAVSSTGTPGVIPAGNYRVSSPLEINNNSVISMHGATLLCYDSGLGSGGYGNTVPILKIEDAVNVSINGGTLDGRNTSGGFGATEHKHGISIYGGSNLTIRDTGITDCKGDGIYIEPLGGDTTPSNVILERVTSNGNYRQGMSILALDSGRFTDCSFINTSGTNPQSGVDLEPEEDTSIVRDLVFTRCHFDGNSGSGFVVSFQESASDLQRDISLVDCTICSNEQWGLWLANATAFTARNTKIQDNANSEGIWIMEGTNEDILIDACHITGNGDNGILVRGLAAPINVKGLRIVNNVVGRNSARTDNNFAGIRFDGSAHAATITDALIEGNTIGKLGGSTQVYGIGWGAGVSYNRFRLIDNDFSEGNTLKHYDFTAATVAVPTTVLTRDNMGWVTRNAGVVSVADTGTITHNLAATPTRYGATATTADEFVSISAVSDTTLTIKITKHDGTAGTTANIAWWAEV